MTKPLTIACVGLGGYAGSVCQQLEKASDAASPPVRLEAACEPDQQLHAEKIAALQQRGVRIYRTIDELLAKDSVQSVWLPVPIHLHRPFTEMSLAAGKAVMVEKPIAGSVQDVDAMIAARDAAGLPAAVGYQDMWCKENLWLKRQLRAGRIGKIKWASVVGCWPRNSKYFGRNQWAGALKRGNIWVLDSPANNALAHHVNLSLYLLGEADRESATPEVVHAELYRVNEIENYDTCSMVAEFANDVKLTVLLTHACEQVVGPVIRLVGTQGVAIVEPGIAIKIIDDKGEDCITPEPGSRAGVPEGFANFVRGIDDDRPTGTLESARAQTVLINAASEASPVSTIPDAYIQMVENDEGDTLRMIPGIQQVFTTLAESGESLHASGKVPWSISPGTAQAGSRYQTFTAPAS